MSLKKQTNKVRVKHQVYSSRLSEISWSLMAIPFSLVRRSNSGRNELCHRQKFQWVSSTLNSGLYLQGHRQNDLQSYKNQGIMQHPFYTEMPEAWEWDPGVEVFTPLSCWSQAHPQSGDIAVEQYFSSRWFCSPGDVWRPFSLSKLEGYSTFPNDFFLLHANFKVPRRGKPKGTGRKTWNFYFLSESQLKPRSKSPRLVFTSDLEQNKFLRNRLPSSVVWTHISARGNRLWMIHLSPNKAIHTQTTTVGGTTSSSCIQTKALMMHRTTPHDKELNILRVLRLRNLAFKSGLGEISQGAVHVWRITSGIGGGNWQLWRDVLHNFFSISV